MNMVQRHGEATCLSCMVPWPGRAGYKHGSAVKFSGMVKQHDLSVWFHGMVQRHDPMASTVYGAECPSGSGIQNPETE